MRSIVVFLLLCVLVFCGVAAAETLQEFDLRIEKELAALDAGAVPLWQQANTLRSEEKHDEAAKAYAAVFARVPSFVHALRRQAGEELELGARAQALDHLRQAVSLERSAENLSALAAGLVHEETPAAKELDEARTLAGEAARMKPNDPFQHQVLAMVAIAADDLDALRSATTRLEKLDPSEPGTHLFRAMIEASDRNWDLAKAALGRARDNGLDEKHYQELLASYESAQPLYVRWGRTALIALGVWFGGFAALLIAGAILSQVALRAARRPPATSTGSASGLSGGVRRSYSAVLFLSCVFYYASIPIVMLIVLGIGGGLLYAVFAAGRVPVKLVIFVVAIVGVTLWSMIKSFFVRAEDQEPGTKLDLRSEPRLRRLLDDVARRIGTRPVDNVYLTPGTEVAVMERGKRARKERCLILGVAALDGLRVRPFKAVLGHEYGHFTNRDTAGGTFALSVRRSMGATAYGLATGGAAAWYNPAWLFVNGFNRVFLRISEGASRLQEMLADRWAAFAYGADAFEEGLRHVVERAVRFDAHVGATLREVVDRKLPLANLYTYQPSEKPDDVANTVNEALNRKASAYDSHPAPAERFELLRGLQVRSRRVEPDDDAPAWSLFSSPEKLQQAMTAEVRANVAANYGVAIQADGAV
jgi:Zn-dependent protease with chaperone function